MSYQDIILNNNDYKIISSNEDFFLNENDIKRIQGAINLNDKNILNNMIRPYNNENEILLKKKEALNAFQYFDKDKNGLINAHEFKEILSLIGNFNNDEINEFLGRASVEGNGYINYMEFVNFLIK